MTRLSILTLASTILLAACATPIETRVESVLPTPLPAEKIFSFTEKPEQNNSLYREARTLVADALAAQGFSQADGAPILVQIALADRPADISIDVGEKDKKFARAEPKKQKFLQSCKDREHRLIISLTNQATGNNLYSGIASEYHCKGTLEASLPHLVRGAMADLDADPTTGPRKRSAERNGIE